MEKEKRNLTQPEKFKVKNYVEANIGRFEKKGANKLAAMINDDNVFDVVLTKSNIASTLIAFGLQERIRSHTKKKKADPQPTEPDPGQKSAARQERTVDYFTRLTELEKLVEVLAGVVNTLNEAAARG